MAKNVTIKKYFPEILVIYCVQSGNRIYSYGFLRAIGLLQWVEMLIATEVSPGSSAPSRTTRLVCQFDVCLVYFWPSEVESAREGVDAMCL